MPQLTIPPRNHAFCCRSYTANPPPESPRQESFDPVPAQNILLEKGKGVFCWQVLLRTTGTQTFFKTEVSCSRSFSPQPATMPWVPCDVIILECLLCLGEISALVTLRVRRLLWSNPSLSDKNDPCLPSQSASEKHNQAHNPLRTLWMCRPCLMIIKSSYFDYQINKPFTLDLFCALFTWSWHTTCAKDHWCLFLKNQNYPQISEARKSYHRLFKRTRDVLGRNGKTSGTQS